MANISRLIITIFIIIQPFSNLSLAEDEYNFDYNYASIYNKCQAYDPYERINRKLLYVNGALDFLILKPYAKMYVRVTNPYIRARVGSVLKNIKEPVSTVNYALQGRGNGLLSSMWRFIINSTLGIGGLFDVAGEFGLDYKPQDFGTTLGYYGVGPGPYIVVPFYGFTTLRDLPGLINIDKTVNLPKQYLDSNVKTVLSYSSIIHGRSESLTASGYASKNSTDLYIMIRDAYIQQRESQMEYPKDFVCPTPFN